MGTVYRAQDLLLARTVAIKHLQNADAEGANSQRRFLNEARSVATLLHPGIVTLYDALEEHGDRYLVMEYVAGRSLRDILRHGPLPADSAIRIGTGLAEAVAYAHEHGIVHGDIKPENVIVAPGGQPKLLDFGLARLDEHRTSASTAKLGTLLYAAPERLEGGPPSKAADVYALGLVLFEMLTGRLPFAGTGLAAATRRLRDRPERLRDVQPRLPATLDAALERALARRPAERLAAAALAGLLKGLPADSLRASTQMLPRQAARRGPSQLHKALRPWGLRLAGVVLLVAATAFALSRLGGQAADSSAALPAPEVTQAAGATGTPIPAPGSATPEAPTASPPTATPSSPPTITSAPVPIVPVAPADKKDRDKEKDDRPAPGRGRGRGRD
jgi:serine/threonine-protein kinase